MDPKKTCNRPQATQPSFNEAMTFQLMDTDGFVQGVDSHAGTSMEP